MRVPGSGVGPPGRDHRKARDVDHAALAELDPVGTVLGHHGHDRLAGHVAAADEDLGVIEPGGVEELLPADLGAVQVGCKKDLRHVCYLSTRTLRISRSKPET